MAIVSAFITAKHVYIVDGSTNSVVAIIMILMLMIWNCLVMTNMDLYFT